MHLVSYLYFALLQDSRLSEINNAIVSGNSSSVSNLLQTEATISRVLSVLIRFE
jgi:hypothetical protein